MDFIVCWKWSFAKDRSDRYFYCETKDECSQRIKKTYKCADSDFLIKAMQLRDIVSNKLIKEVCV